MLIIHIAELLLTRKFFCFRKGPHISFKYAQHSHLRCPMMGEVPLEILAHLNILVHNVINLLHYEY